MHALDTLFNIAIWRTELPQWIFRKPLWITIPSACADPDAIDKEIQISELHRRAYLGSKAS